MAVQEEPTCPECETEELIRIEGDYYCPACDSASGFELIPNREDFIL